MREKHSMTDTIVVVLILFLVGAAVPLLAIAVVAERGKLSWRRAIVVAALSEIPVAWAAAAFLSLFAECVSEPCPEQTLWAWLRWWSIVGGIGALDGALVASLVLSIKWALDRAYRTA